MNKVITEITPIKAEDCFYLVDRFKKCFDFPIHVHHEMEINLVENCEGARRIVGDSVEILGKYDLVIVGSNLEHVWEQYQCKSSPIREITIQFMPDIFGSTLLSKKQFQSVAKLFEKARSGIAFGLSAIMRNYDLVKKITNSQPDFYRVLRFMELCHRLSCETDCHTLASSSFANVEDNSDSRRIRKVEEFVRTHFDQEIRLEQAADLVCMSPTAFSRFFKLHTGRTFSEYIIEIRLGTAARLLANSQHPIQEICYECGFNNISNFNRIFKRKRGHTPSEFRDLYRKSQVII